MPNRTLILIIPLALTYFAIGKLALLLAIPPGYATAIWPSAGIALSAILLKGYRLWPGVLLGSFLVNVDGMPSLSSSFLTSFFVPMVIATGAALQAVLGAWLIRRYIGSRICLDSISEVFKFLVFACGVSCAASASIGTTALLSAGLLPAENYIFNWFTWWVGDGLGVMITSILIFVYFGEPRAVWRSRRRVLPLVLVSVSLVVVTLYVLGSRWELSRQQGEFRRYSQQIFNAAQSKIDTHIDDLHAVKAFIEVSGGLSRETYEAFVKGFLDRNAGFQAIVWVQRVGAAERLAFEASIGDELGAPVTIMGRDQDGSMIVQPVKDDYFVIRYIEPMAKNVGALSYDISSTELVQNALSRASLSGMPATTGPISLVQERDGQLGLVVYLPVNAVSSTMGGGDLSGYVAGVYRVPDLMAVLLPRADLRNLSGAVSSLDGSGKIYSINSLDSKQALFSDSAVLHFADIDWLFEVEADQGFLVGSRSMVPWTMLVAGFLFTGLLGMTFLVLTGQKHRSDVAGAKLKEMLLKLRETQDHLVESEKMASLGGLVAGFAHELNTPLGIAITAESTLQSDLGKLRAALDGSDSLAPVAETLSRMQEASRMVLSNVQRAGALIMSFKQVSVDQATAEIRDINLHEYLTDVLSHLSSSYRSGGHNVSLDCPKDIRIQTVPGGVAQVLMNLLSNSLTHAFPCGKSGNICLSVCKRYDHVVLRFSDDGIGIPVADQKKVFEPFYTTRRGAGGTGLGLHIVYNTVKRQLRGRISVNSQPGGGTVIEIVLPLMINDFASQGEEFSSVV